MEITRQYWEDNWPEILKQFPYIPDMTQKLQHSLKRSLEKSRKERTD